MHTFMLKKGKFEVGMWLINQSGYASWHCICTVHTADLADVMKVVNHLNGGPASIGRLTIEVED